MFAGFMYFVRNSNIAWKSTTNRKLTIKRLEYNILVHLSYARPEYQSLTHFMLLIPFDTP